MFTSINKYSAKHRRKILLKLRFLSVIAFLALLFINPIFSQNIIRAEYFLNSDPGFGNGNQITITPSQNIQNINFDIDISSLSIGFNYLYIRAKDDSNSWSQTSVRSFYKEIINSNLQNIVKVEYFIDTDPGFGSATNIPISSASQIDSISFIADISNISLGFHNLNIRAKDQNGIWSLVNLRTFYKETIYPSAQNITKAEYFFDTDPGFGNGINIPLSSSSQITGLSFIADISNLTIGFHNLNIRTKDQNGIWSETNTRTFYKEFLLVTSQNIVKVEYFIDTDPGYGNGTNISIIADSVITGISFIANISGLTTGFHHIYIRTKAQNGEWSQTNIRSFFKENISIAPQNIVKAEYFLNTDPGFGNGVNIPIVPDSQILNISFITDISSLSTGFYELYVRTKDVNGKWSQTNVRNFYKETISTVQKDIVQLEYFIDTDPGFGNATQINFTPNHDTSLFIDISMNGLTQGSHYLLIRAKDQDGNWSIVNNKDFFIDKEITLIDNPVGKGILIGEGFYPTGYSLSISANPVTGYNFVNWTENSSIITSSSNYSFTVNENRTLTANFSLIYYNLNYSASANGSISGNTSQSVGHGNNGTQVQAIPSTGYHFISWSDNSTDNPRIDSNITSDLTVTANFAINTYTLSYDQGNYGSLSGISPQTVNYNTNGTVVEIIPFSGYQFVNWSDGINSNPRQDTAVSSDHIVSANYAYNQFILISPSNNSTINTDTVQFKWSEIFNARYKLLVDNEISFQSPEISSNNISELSNLTITQYTICGNWLSEGNYYWKVRAIIGNDTLTSDIWSFYYNPPKQTSPEWVSLYRAYFSDDVDHFYCSSTAHKVQAISGGYNFEGTEGYVALHPFDVNSPDTIKPIFRLYSPSSFTEKMKTHIYICNTTVRDSLINEEWIYEGITGYGLNNIKSGYVKLFRTELNQTTPDLRRDNFYTISELKKNFSILKHGYNDKGFICYIFSGKDTCEQEPGINPHNGNYGDYSSIYAIPEGKISLNYGHFYNSNAVHSLFSITNPLGVGRTHNYDKCIIKTDSSIYVLWGDRILEYNSQNLECLIPGCYDILIQINTTKYQVKKKNQTVYTFDCLPSLNLNEILFLTSIIDRYGNELTLEYFSDGKLKWVKSPSGRFITFTYYPDSDYSKYGLIRYVKDSLALDRVVEYQYDNDRNLIRFIDAKSQSTYFAYEDDFPYDHFLKTITSPDGTKITNSYDSISKRIISQNYISNDISKLTTVSIPTNDEITITDENNIETKVQYDKFGNLLKVTTQQDSVTYEYNDSIYNPKLPTKIIDKMGNPTSFSYSSNGNPLTINKPEDISEQFQWNSENDLISYTNPLGKITYFNYTNGFLTSTQLPFGSSSSSTYSFTYFSNGNLHTTSNPLNQIITYSYNSRNNIVSVSDNLNHTTTYGYDNASRITSLTDANGHTTTYGYDNNDLMTFSLDPMNNLKSYYYNGSDKLISVKDVKNHSTSISYNGNTGLMQSVTDQLGHSTQFTYYDNGQLKSEKDRKNQTINYDYDTLNRLNSITASGLSRTYTYNSNDVITQVIDNNGSLNFEYDSVNRITSYIDIYSNQMQYEYDKLNRITKIIYPGNKEVNYTYFDDNSLHTVVDWMNNTTSYQYNNDGSISRVDNPNGTFTSYSYDGAGRLISLENRRSDSSIICSYSYTLDNVGNHIEVVSYESYLGIPKNIGGQSEYNFGTYNNANRIQSLDTSEFVHDLNGNMTLKNDTGDITNYSYDIENRLTAVDGMFNATYTYDALGNRCASTLNGISKRYILDINRKMSNVLIETDNSNTTLYYYIYGNGLLYRIRATDDSVQHYHYDYRGSTIAITDENQHITHKYSYDVFGKVIQSNEQDFNPFQFVGKYGVMYEDSALYFMRARYYNPHIARFITEDPIWDVNLYTYAGNNSVMNIDPNGENFFEKLQIIDRIYSISSSVRNWFNFAKAVESDINEVSNEDVRINKIDIALVEIKNKQNKNQSEEFLLQEMYDLGWETLSLDQKRSELISAEAVMNNSASATWNRIKKSKTLKAGIQIPY